MPPRPRGACPDQPATRPNTAEGRLLPSPGAGPRGVTAPAGSIGRPQSPDDVLALDGCRVGGSRRAQPRYQRSPCRAAGTAGCTAGIVRSAPGPGRGAGGGHPGSHLGGDRARTWPARCRHRRGPGLQRVQPGRPDRAGRGCRRGHQTASRPAAGPLSLSVPPAGISAATTQRHIQRLLPESRMPSATTRAITGRLVSFPSIRAPRVASKTGLSVAHVRGYLAA